MLATHGVLSGSRTLRIGFADRSVRSLGHRTNRNWYGIRVSRPALLFGRSSGRAPPDNVSNRRREHDDQRVKSGLGSHQYDDSSGLGPTFGAQWSHSLLDKP